MLGTWTVRLAEVRPFTIHGDLYYELVGTRADDGSAVVLRVPQHATAAVGGQPAAGRAVAVTFLMGQVTEVRPAP